MGIHHQLKRAGLKFRWYVVGSGPEERAIREEISRLEMDDDFILLSRQENLYAEMNACDVFASFSSSEGCPTVVLEALGASAVRS